MTDNKPEEPQPSSGARWRTAADEDAAASCNFDCRIGWARKRAGNLAGTRSLFRRRVAVFAWTAVLRRFVHQRQGCADSGRSPDDGQPSQVDPFRTFDCRAIEVGTGGWEATIPAMSFIFFGIIYLLMRCCFARISAGHALSIYESTAQMSASLSLSR